MLLRRITFPVSLSIALLLSACGGGGGSSSTSASPVAATFSVPEPGAPAATGNTSTDGINWFNFRRQQLGLSVLTRNSLLDASAQNHSNYQALNSTITHVETTTKAGFTGTTLLDRYDAAGYHFAQYSYAYGEVISSATTSSGVYAAESLITAIYHRFVVFEPMFKEMGAGSAVSGSGYNYFTTDFAADGLSDAGLGHGQFITYPFAGETSVPRNFFSDTEIPDPVPSRNEVGYPISVHANITSTVTVQTFTVAPHGGSTLPVQLLTHANDPETGTGVAAIIPLSPLAATTTYDVQFAGTVDGVAVSRNWSFTTQ